MRIALTHNLQTSDAEDEAEFDRPETIQAISEALVRLGHVVEPVEVSGPASRTVARLEALAPDLIFNTAEGKRGRFREAFYPGLFDQLGFPYTGSDAYVCALTLDKNLTKMVVASAGVRVPRGAFVDHPSQLADLELDLPAIVKPNYEGSSKGIDQDAVVETREALEARVRMILERYPTGVLVEEYITGRDVVVPYLQALKTKQRGILPAAEYEFDQTVVGNRKYVIYDYSLKQVEYDAVTVRAPAELSTATQRELVTMSRDAISALGIRDLGRLDFRVRDDGRAYFIEANALPSLEPGAGIYVSAALEGCDTIDAVLSTVIKSACARQGIPVRGKSRSSKRPLRVGLTFNLKRIKPADTGDDSEAEFDSETTVGAVEEAIRSYGHDVVRLEATGELPALVAASDVAVVFNIAEGIRGRSREAQVPALLELLDIPFTGSDAATLSLALDKGLAKRVVSHAGVPTAGWTVWQRSTDRLPTDVTFPVIVKPNFEGSSKGVSGPSVAETEAELRKLAEELIDRYRQSVLIESFLPGREFTIGLLGERRPKVLPPMEIRFAETAGKFPVYSFEHKLDWSRDVSYAVPTDLDPALLRDLEKLAKGAFIALGCRDVARIDVRLDAKGKPHFIECNPLPGLSPGWSDLCLIAEAAKIDYRTLIGEILAPSIKRYRHKTRAVGSSPRMLEA